MTLASSMKENLALEPSVHELGGLLAPVTWTDGEIAILTDPMHYPNRDRVFPIFEDENVLLRRLIREFGGATVLDVGTGSGLLAIAAAKEGCDVDAIDINPRALRFAKHNAAINEVGKNIHFLRGDVFPPFLRKYDIVLSNPPFIPNPGRGLFHIAGDGGWDGARMIRRLIAGLCTVLRPDGLLIMTALSLQRSNEPYIGEMVRMQMPEGQLAIHTIYDGLYPLTRFAALFSRFCRCEKWVTNLLKRRFQNLSYTMIVFRNGSAPLPTLSSLGSKLTRFSGSWERRLDRYEFWLSLRERPLISDS
jgi:HemK-related putative methylase